MKMRGQEENGGRERDTSVGGTMENCVCQARVKDRAREWVCSVAWKVTDITGMKERERERGKRVKMSERQWKSLRIVKTDAVVHKESAAREN